MSPYREPTGKIAWGRIIEGIIIVLTITLLSGGFNWFMGMGELKHDFKELRKDVKRVGTQTAVIGKSLWNHLHPEEPCPWPDEMIKDGESK